MIKISNPLTIIGMFAGIAEVAGTVVLPFISEDIQYIFIWYVMMFPILLVIVFFLTLNFNSDALYAPSDYKDENNYIKIREMAKKIEMQVGELKEKNPCLSKDFEPIQKSINDLLTIPEINFKLNDLKIMELIAKSQNGITAFEISAKSGMHRSSINRILKDLIDAGYILEETIPEKSLKYERLVRKYKLVG